MRSVITEAKVTKRYNTGDYEFEELTLGAVVDEKDSGADVLKELKKQIHQAFTGEEVEEQKPSAKKADKKEEKKKDVKSKTNSSDDEDESAEDSESEDSGDDTESTEDNESTDDEAGDDSDDSSNSSEDESSDEDGGEEGEEGQEKEISKPSKSGKDSGKKGRKKYSAKPQDYNRSIEQHKGLFSSVLGLVAPDWKKTDASKKQAKEASEKLEGTPFLDGNGEVLESFKAEVKKLMSAKKK